MLTFASVVSCEIVFVSFLISALNDLDIWAMEIMNAYMMAPNHKKVWTTLGHEFWSKMGRKTIIIHALYGLKFTSATLWDHLAGNPNATLYYSDIKYCMDNILVIHNITDMVMKWINGYFLLKPDLVGPWTSTSASY
jgi:hypothetical protein